MNKTVTCNIAGLVFHIEENAFERLQNYLNAVKMRLSNSEDQEEIIRDIEARIAELFSGSISSRQEVVLDKNVQDVIAALGAPEDYIIDDENEGFKDQSAHQRYAKQQNPEKTLMRDTDNGVIAGVCAGVAAYVGWDVVFVRILFLLALFLTGFGLVVYLVLWIAAPKAQTSTDRLRMQGKPINLDTISQEVEEAAERLERYASSPKTRNNINAIKSKGHEIWAVIRRFVGVLLLIGGVVGILFFLFVSMVENGFFIDHDGESPVSLYHFSEVIFNSNIQAITGWASILVMFLLPFLFATISGVFMIFNLRSRIIGKVFFTLMGFWVAGIILFLIVSAQIARDFTFRESVERELYSIAVNELRVEIPDEIFSGSGFSLSDEDDFRSLYVNQGQVSFGHIQLEFIDSKDSLFHVSSTHYASGISRRKAYSRIDNMEHQVALDSNYIRIAPSFRFPLSDRLRNQKVVVRIAIPKNSKVEWVGSKRNMYETKDYRAKAWEEE